MEELWYSWARLLLLVDGATRFLIEEGTAAGVWAYKAG